MTTYAFSEEKAQAVLDIFEKHDELLTQRSQDMEGVDLAAQACLDICTTWKIPTGVKITISIAGHVVLTKVIGKC